MTWPTRNVFVSNTAAGSVSVLSGSSDSLLTSLSTTRDPFGIAVDPTTRRVYVGHRDPCSITVLNDIYGP